MNHSQKETIETLTYNFHQTWEVLKVIASTDYKYDKPLNFRVLKSYNHSVTKILLYIHSMVHPQYGTSTVWYIHSKVHPQ